MSANNDKRKQLIDSTETYKYWTSKDLGSTKEEIKWNNIKKTQKRLTLIVLQKKT